MTELTTGILFLVSSLYGPSQVTNNTASVINASSTTPRQTISTSTKSEIFTTNDPKVMEKYLKQEYADDLILVDIARCESSFRQFDKDGNVIHGLVNKADVGVMQINEKYHADMASKLGFDLHTIPGNVAYAKHLYAEEGVKPWSSSSKCWSNRDDNNNLVATN